MVASPLAPSSQTPSVYADGSALVQFLPGAPFHDAWTAWAQGKRFVTSQVGVTELRRVAWPLGVEAQAAAHEVELEIETVRFSQRALETASHVSTALPSFVALHLGAAVSQPGVEAVATYQVELARVAALFRLPVVTPGWPARWWEAVP